jgi:hypothetical protein
VRVAGLSPLPALANSSSDEEESDGERTTSDRWEPAPPSSQAEGSAVELTPEAGMESPAVGLSVEVSAGTAEVPAGAVEVPAQPSRKRKRGFSSLRFSSNPSCTPSASRRNHLSPPFVSLSGRCRPSLTLRLSRR